MGPEIELSRGKKMREFNGFGARSLLLMECFQLFLVPRVLNFIIVPGLRISMALIDSLAATWRQGSSETFMEM